MRKHFIPDTQTALVTGLTFPSHFVFGGCFDTDIKFCIFISHFIRCHFCTFTVSHFTFQGMGNMRLVRLRPVRLGPRVICV